MDPPTGSPVALDGAATGVPERTKGLAEDGFALKLAVSVNGLPQDAGGAVAQGRPGANPEES